MNRWMVSPADILGEEVHGADGERLGRIEDIMLDAEHGRIAYAVLSFAGAPGKLFAVPWEAMAIDTARGGDGWRLEVDRARFAQAPAFERGDWPNFADPQFAVGIYRHYGIPPYWDTPREMNS